MIAGVSVDYYTRLEKGNLVGVSEGVLNAVARALQLDDVERAHLFDLSRIANTPAPRSPRRPTAPARVRPGVQRLLDAMTEVAAFARNGRLDVLAANHLGYALYAPVFTKGGRPVNLARYVFLDPRAHGFYADWESIAAAAVRSLRGEAGRDPYDPALSSLIGDLSLRSEEFRTRWAAHDVTQYRTGTQPFHHPLVGDLTLDYNVLELPAEPGQVIVAYTAHPDSPAHDALTLLATWAATDVIEERMQAPPERNSPPDSPDQRRPAAPRASVRTARAASWATRSFSVGKPRTSVGNPPVKPPRGRKAKPCTTAVKLRNSGLAACTSPATVMAGHRTRLRS